MRQPLSRPQIRHSRITSFQDFRNSLSLKITFEDVGPLQGIATGKVMAKAWANSLKELERESSCLTFIYRVIESYWDSIHKDLKFKRGLPELFQRLRLVKLDTSVSSVARAIGISASKLDVVEASYQLGNLYTAVLPEAKRSNQGIFYTPPALTKRLIEISEKAGIDWSTASIVDPACGGGAFLAPVVLKIKNAVRDMSSKDLLDHIQRNLKGYEIDPFGGWLSQVFVEVALKSEIDVVKKRIDPLVKICDSLSLEIQSQYDLVIGNPPYGKVSLDTKTRSKFQESLYGHANLYGLFTHLALGLVKEGGIIGFVTPTSFLSGEYFKKLRIVIRSKATPIETDFITFRKGVFDGVLQETMLAVYKKSVIDDSKVLVNQLVTPKNGELELQSSGSFQLSHDNSAPWILPRAPYQARIVRSLNKMHHNLKSWGYQVSTGPLVWNRHKKQLTDNTSPNTYPIVWSEAISQDGCFKLKSEKRNHKQNFRFQAGDEWLVTKAECILLQRTTAKEQEKRLVAALLPSSLIRRNKGVVIENHLNMILPLTKEPEVELAVLTFFLNSKAANDSFRTISGSVAVSAYELESLPLPDLRSLGKLRELIKNNESIELIERECHNII
jgi:adenine-specific DNA-methyltransferase